MSHIINIKNKPTPYYDIYIGRENTFLGLPQSKWHNPFPMKAEYQRLGVIENFYNYVVMEKQLIASLYELDNQILGCYCAPKFCHGNILQYLRSKQIRGEKWEEKFNDEVYNLLRLYPSFGV